MGRYNRRQNHRAGDNSLLIFLGTQLVSQILALDVKPPITLALIALNYAIYTLPTIPRRDLPFEVAQLVSLIPSPAEGGLIPAAVIRYGEYGRLFWSAIIHADALHLYYNMASLLFKGAQLESALGSAKFLFLISELWFSEQVIYCAIQWAALHKVAPNNPYTNRGYYNTCAVGFSGILFGLKVVLNHGNLRWQHVSVPGLGVLTLPPKAVAWVELIAIQLITPRASFVGHLCGILAGLLHVHFTSRIWNLLRSSRRPGRSRAGYDDNRSQYRSSHHRPRFSGSGYAR